MELTNLSDSLLVQGYLCGNEPCLEVLINRYQARLYTYIITRVRDEDIANDIFQDSFVKVINTLKSGKYKEEGKFYPWLQRIAHNLVIDFFRREKRMPTTSPTDEFDVFDVLPDEKLNIEGEMIQEQVYSDLMNLINHLPPEQQEVLRLRIYNDLSFKEIAEQTDVSINTALGRMRYALINMRRLIDQNQINLLLG